MPRFILCFVLAVLVKSSFANDYEAIAQATLSHISQTQLKEEVDWSDYSLSDSVSDSHKKWLKKRILSLRNHYLSSEFKFEVYKVKVEGDLAMLVLDVKDPQDPYFFQAVSFALCESEAGWQVAPLAGSYRFSGIKNYIQDVVERRVILEKWASKLVGERIAEVSAEQLKFVKNAMAEHRSKSSPLSGDSRELAARYFIEQCRNKDIYGMLACVSDSDLNARNSLLAAMRDSNDRGQWDVLLSKNYFYVHLSRPKNLRSTESVGIFSPQSEKQTSIVELELKSEGASWTIGLPAYLSLKLKRDENFPRFPQFQKYQLKSENRQRLDSVDELIINQLISSSFDTVEKVIEEAERCIKEHDAPAFFRLIEWEAQSGDTEAKRLSKRKIFYTSLKYWNELTKEDCRFSLDKIEVVKSENRALFCSLIYSYKRPIEYVVAALSLVKKEGDWFVQDTSGIEGAINSYSVNPREKSKLKVLMKGGVSHAFTHILPKVSYLKGADLLAVREPSSIEKDYAQYAEKITSHQWDDVSDFLAVEAGGEGSLLKVLGYEALFHRSLLSDTEFVEIISIGNMTGLVVRERFKTGAADCYRLYPYVCLEAGLKILPQCVYLYEHTRGEVLLNTQISDEIEQRFDVAFLNSRAKLIELFNIKVEKRKRETNE